MKRIFVPSSGPKDWKGLLASEKQWRSGFSAKTLAHCWESLDGFPPEIARLFAKSKESVLQQPEILVAIPEYKVMLPGGARPSQNDLFILARSERGLVVIMIEGKVSETFGPTLREWRANESKGKNLRLGFLKEQLGLPEQDIPEEIRYQLMHRTVSAVLEAKRFFARDAVMIVHSFSKDNHKDKQSFEDYRNFLKLFKVTAESNQLVFVADTQGIRLYCGWAEGDKRFLDV
jgi:hypothetical protein